MKKLLSPFPQFIQYVIIIGVIMLILYVCLKLTRLLGEKHGEKVDYNDPEEAETAVPDVFASTMFRRKKKSPPESSDHKDNRQNIS